MRKILLIAPPYPRIQYNISGVYPMPPLGLAYIASYLKQNNIEAVEIFDMPLRHLAIKDLKDALKAKNFSIYGITSTIFSLSNCIEIARYIKESSPNAMVVLGGPATSSFPPEIIFQYGKHFDIIVHGEGEQTMLRLYRKIGNGSSFQNISNISYKEKDGKIFTNTNDNYLDLDKLPFPARYLLDNRYYRMHPPFGLYPPVTLMECSRGCCYDCIFCSLPKILRERSPENIIDEIKEVVHRYHIREIHFIDPSFTYNNEKITELCELIIKYKIKFNWSCKTRTDLVNKELPLVMRKAGCYMISYGVESGSQAILNNLNKNLNLEKTEKAFYVSRKSGIRTIAYILLGSPGESDKTVKETLNFVKKLTPDFVLFGELLPDPNSDLTRALIKEKKLVLHDIADYYILHRNIFSNATFLGFKRKNISKWLNRANQAFYFDLKYILMRIFKIKNLNEFVCMLKGVYFLCLDKFFYPFKNNFSEETNEGSSC